MTATRVIQVTPFGVVKGDTYPVPSLSFEDDEGNVLDPAGWDVTLNRWAVTGEPSSMPGTIDGDVVSFPWLTDDTLVGTQWQTSVTINDTSLQYTLSTSTLYVYDASTWLCSVSDVVAIIGDSYSQYDIMAAIEQASAAVTAWVVLPIGTPVPLAVRRATALLAARAVTAVPGSSTNEATISSERIGDYEVRYAADDDGAGATLTDDVKDLLRPWRPQQYMGDIGEVRSPSDTFDEEGYVTL